jgi:BirA family biotin operon repressor/biotin-[acetyl-CoA-carboxylase] ligase
LSQLPHTTRIGAPFIELQSVDSTNNYARQQIHAGLAQHGMVIFGHEQTTGRGQRGRVWVAEKGKNITLSIIIRPQGLLLSQQFQLSACIAVAVHDFFKKYTAGMTSIKWPNDLYWQDRKAGGVLMESVAGNKVSYTYPPATSEWSWAIVGIGINVNQAIFPDHLPNPVSLKQITGKEFNVINLARELCGEIEHRFSELMQSGFEAIFNTYNQHLYKIKQRVRFKKQNRVFEGVVNGVNHAGQLIVHHSIEEELDFGEIKWVI